MKSTDMVKEIWRAIVVEDTEDWQDRFKGYLEEAGFEVIIAPSLGKADFLINRYFFHLAVVDLALDPKDDTNRDGLKVLKKIQDLNEGTCSMLISGVGTMEIGWEAGFHGAITVIEKRHFEMQVDKYIAQAKLGLAQAKDKLSKYHVGIDFLAGPEPIVVWVDGVMRTFSPKRGYATLDQFSSRLLKGLYPLLRLKSQLTANIDKDSRTGSVCLWSKNLGSPIFVKFGNTEIIQSEVESMVENEKKLKESGYEELLRSYQLENLAGVVYLLSGPDFEQFEPRHVHQTYFSKGLEE